MALRNEILPAQLANQTARRLLAYSGTGIPELIAQFVATDGRLDLLSSAFPNNLFRIIESFRLPNVNNVSYIFSSGQIFDQPDSVVTAIVIFQSKAPDGSQSSMAITAGAFRKDGAANPVQVGASVNLLAVDDIPGANATFSLAVSGSDLVYNWNSNQVLVNHDIQAWLIMAKMV